MRRIAVLTSGGDAPGMNAAIRAVVRTGIGRGWEVFGVRHGYAGLIGDDMGPLSARDVGGILQRGGTMLGSARSAEFETIPGREKAIRNLNAGEIEALVVIGGNGSQTGAHCLSQMGFPVVGVASTIDNDLVGSDITIGVDTALNIALALGDAELRARRPEGRPRLLRLEQEASSREYFRIARLARELLDRKPQASVILKVIRSRHTPAGHFLSTMCSIYSLRK